MRAAVILASLPVAVFGAWHLPTPRSDPPIKPKPVTTEGVRAARQDDTSFNRRWSAVQELPPAMIEIAVERSSSSSLDPVREAAAGTPKRIDTRRRLVVRSARLDVCARHKMRREVYLIRGHRYWRCRR